MFTTFMSTIAKWKLRMVFSNPDKVEAENYRSSRQSMFFKKSALKNFAILTGKHLGWSLHRGGGK